MRRYEVEMADRFGGNTFTVTVNTNHEDYAEDIDNDGEAMWHYMGEFGFTTNYGEPVDFPIPEDEWEEHYQAEWEDLDDSHGVEGLLRDAQARGFVASWDSEEVEA